MIRRPPRSTLFPTRRSSDLTVVTNAAKAPAFRKWQPSVRARLRCVSCHASKSRAKLPTNRVVDRRSEEHTSELQSQSNLVCRLLLEKKKTGTGSDEATIYDA